MLIRSQNRRMLVNMANVDCLGIIELSPENFDISAYNRDANTTLGFYSTQEKAKKVLDMIQNGYASCFPPMRAFQMPADEEVTL